MRGGAGGDSLGGHVHFFEACFLAFVAARYVGGSAHIYAVWGVCGVGIGGLVWSRGKGPYVPVA